VNAPRAQSVADADRDLRQYLIRIAGTLGDLLGEVLAGLYVYGSLATGAYHRERSGLDLLGVVTRKLTPKERESLARTLLRISDARPTRGDIRVSIVEERYARSFEHPLPYEVQYTQASHEAIRRGRVDYSQEHTDVDLAANFVEVRGRGVTLVGPPPESLFGYVPWHAYVNALEAHFNRGRASVVADPANAVLDACRVLRGATSTAMETANKDEAAVWALASIPRMYHSVVNDALQIYRGTKSEDDVVFAERDVIALREYVRERSQGAFARASDTGDDDDE
jgi:streptomycin 3"-adenylyltransferase